MPFLDADDRKLIVDEVEDELLALEGDMLDDVEVDSETVLDITERTSEETSEPPAKKKKKVQYRSLSENCFSKLLSHHIHCLPIPAKWLENWNYTKLKNPSTLTQIP